MNNPILSTMKEMNNVSRTENGAVCYRSTMNAVQDLFALGGSYRGRSDGNCIFLFEKAFEEDQKYAMKCLFYLRDVRGGAGERRFFRTVTRWLAFNYTEIMRRNLPYIPIFGRWDDLYAFVDTPLEKDAFNIMYHQLALDVECKTPSLVAKWLKSENTSSVESKRLGKKTRIAFDMTPKEYRKTLSTLRGRIRVLEKLMSANRWNDIEFDKIPSKAGILYRNAFARHDLEREMAGKGTYKEFAQDKKTVVNADTLNPCDVVHKAREVSDCSLESTERLMVNKYWDNLKDYFKGATFNGVAVVDTSGSMCWGSNSILPIDVAISLGLYCAEKCNPRSPWYKHYITFSREAHLTSINGVDFVDKVKRIYKNRICENTNIESVFNLILHLAIVDGVKPEDIPRNIIIISDMEFDEAIYDYNNYFSNPISLLEGIAKRWKQHGYELPHLIFWNVNARNDNISMRDNGRVTFVSGYSPVIFEMIMTGKTGWDFIKEKLDSDRYLIIK